MKKVYIYFIVSFLLFIIIFVIINKTLGNVYVANLYATEPLTWDEIINKIPRYIIASATLTTVLYYIYNVAQKDKEKREEEARKRIEARKKKKKVQKSEETKTENEKNE